MTLSELYALIGSDYEQAMRVMCVEKLVDKHIRRFLENGVVENLLAAGQTLEPTQMFETAHAVKGVCGNLGLTGLYQIASELSEEFRCGNERKLSDDEVKAKLAELKEQYQTVSEGIRRYEQSV